MKSKGICSFEEIQVVIPAGGYATRMGKLTKACAKILLPVNGKPFIKHQMEWLKEQGIENIHYCLGHLSHQVIEAINNIKLENMKVTYSIESEPLGVAGAIKYAEDYLSDHFFVIQGDVLPQISLKTLYEKYVDVEASFMMSVKLNDLNIEQSNVNVQGDRITDYAAKADSSKYDYLDVGVMLLEKSIVDEVPKDSVYTDKALISTIVRKNKIHAYEVNRYSYEIGSITGYENMNMEVVND